MPFIYQRTFDRPVPENPSLIPESNLTFPCTQIRNRLTNKFESLCYNFNRGTYSHAYGISRGQVLAESSRSELNTKVFLSLTNNPYEQHILLFGRNDAPEKSTTLYINPSQYFLNSHDEDSCEEGFIFEREHCVKPPTIGEYCEDSYQPLLSCESNRCVPEGVEISDEF